MSSRTAAPTLGTVAGLSRGKPLPLRSRRPGFDVLRGLAIGLVLLRHTWDQVFSGGGIVGVVLFFTLSGYLITGVIDRDIRENGRISFTRFYAHRAFRLLPALLLMLAVFAVVESVFNLLGDRPIIAQTVGAALFYIRDLPLPFSTSPAINTLWTLAVEEQFYLVWPVLLLVALRWKSVNRLLIGAFLLITALCFISAIIFAKDPATVYILPTTWASAIVLGAAAYVHRETISDFVTRTALRRWMGSTIALAGFLGLTLLPGAKNTLWVYLVGGPLVAVLTIVLISIVGRWRALPAAVLEPLRRLGMISYAVYIWNALILDWFRSTTSLPRWTEIVATILVAIISWFTVEAWGRRGRRWFDLRSKSLRRTEVAEPAE
jgi:peptidoglycan/LPS O-acetylase OafA/YrhL